MIVACNNHIICTFDVILGVYKFGFDITISMETQEEFSLHSVNSSLPSMNSGEERYTLS